MTWTYSGNPASSSLDAVRFLLGDVDTSNQLVSNEGIQWLLTQNPNPYLAAAMAADTIAANYAKQFSKTVGPLSINYGERRDAYYALAKSLRVQSNAAGSRTTITPINGSNHSSDPLSRHQNPIFGIGMMDDLETEPSTANAYNPLTS